MAGYNMASLHSKHSKQLNLPLGSRWGVPEGTSVADCLNWTWKPQPPPSPAPQLSPEPQLILEEKEKRSVFVTPTTVEIEVPSPAESVETPLQRTTAPTPKHMTKYSTEAKCKTKCRTCQPRTEEWVASSRVTPAEPKEIIRSLTPGPPTTRVPTPGPQTMRTARTSRLNNTTGRFSTVKNGKKAQKKKAPSPPPLTFDEYLAVTRTRNPMVVTTGRPRTPAKFSSYPHYQPRTPHPDDVEYIVKQTRTMKMRTPTPGLASRNGHHGLLTPRTAADDAKEKAIIESIRKELHSSRDVRASDQNPGLSINGEQCQPQHQSHYHQQYPQPRATSAYRPESRSLSRSQSQLLSTRPRSSAGPLEVVKEKKTVGFIDENEYFRYLNYLEERYGEDSRPSSSQARHFGSWRGGATQELARKKPLTTRGWVTPGAESPSKVNVAMDCPENADMTISLRVRNTPSETVY